jgi:hypothetical protein
MLIEYFHLLRTHFFFSLLLFEKIIFFFVEATTDPYAIITKHSNNATQRSLSQLFQGSFQILLPQYFWLPSPSCFTLVAKKKKKSEEFEETDTFWNERSLIDACLAGVIITRFFL